MCTVNSKDQLFINLRITIFTSIKIKNKTTYICNEIEEVLSHGIEFNPERPSNHNFNIFYCTTLANI